MKSKTEQEQEAVAAARLTCDALCSLVTATTQPTTAITTVRTAETTAAPSSLDSATYAMPGKPLVMHGFLYVDSSKAASSSSSSSSSSTTTINSSADGVIKKREHHNISSTTTATGTSCTKISTKASSPKQHQLPLFLSKTYHMIDRCDTEIATWSSGGENFVVKDIEKFASIVLPLYFKHSNFSSFARQLNFYGFRKLRSDPILTNNIDPQTACYVRFYHEKFQKDRPELLHTIKRATKSGSGADSQQSQSNKDDIDSLKSDVFKLKKCITEMESNMERKISEMNFEYNRRIDTISTEYDQLVRLVNQLLQHQQHQPPPQQQPLLPHYPSSQQQHRHTQKVIQCIPVPNPNPPLPPVVVEIATSVVSNGTSALAQSNGTSALAQTTTTSANGGGGSSSLSSSESASLSPSPSSSSYCVVPQPQDQKMQSLSHVVAMSLLGTTTIASIPMAAATITTRVTREKENETSTSKEGSINKRLRVT